MSNRKEKEEEKKASGYITLKIRSGTKELFDMLGEQYHLNNINLMNLMCEFFIKHKISPLETPEMIFKEREKLEKLEKKNIDRIIGFMRNQEMVFLKPIDQKVGFIMDQISDVLLGKEKGSRKEGNARLEELDRILKLRVARDKVLEGLRKVKEKKNILGKITLEFEGVDSYELEKMIKLLEEIDPDVYQDTSS